MDPRIRNFYRRLGIVHDMVNRVGRIEPQLQQIMEDEDGEEHEKMAAATEDGDSDETGNEVEHARLSLYWRVSFQRHNHSVKTTKTVSRLHKYLWL